MNLMRRERKIECRRRVTSPARPARVACLRRTHRIVSDAAQKVDVAIATSMVEANIVQGRSNPADF